MATLVFTGRQVVATRKAIKEMAKAGGHHEVKVDMRPPSSRDAEALVDMAMGCEPSRIHDWVKGEAWNRRQSCWYDRDRADVVIRRPISDRWGSYLKGDSNYRAMYHVAIYARDEEYEARMVEWASRFLADEGEDAA